MSKDEVRQGDKILFVSGQWEGKTGTYAGLVQTGPGLGHIWLHRIMLDKDPCPSCFVVIRIGGGR